MSSLVFQTEEQQVFVATDTLAVTPSGRPLTFTSKALILPHLRMIVAGTGSGGFLDRWFVYINSRMRVLGIDNLNQHTTSNLIPGWEAQKKEFSLPVSATTTVYHFGFSENTGRIRSYAYRSENQFLPEELGYGFGIKPPCSIPDAYELPRDLRKMMDEQRRAELSKPDGETRIYIGGEIIVHHLTANGFMVYPFDRFEDYDSDRRIIFQSAPDGALRAV